MARLGKAGLGMARLGKARQGIYKMENKKNTLGKVLKEHLKTEVQIKMGVIYLIFIIGIVAGVFL